MQYPANIPANFPLNIREGESFVNGHERRNMSVQ